MTQAELANSVGGFFKFLDKEFDRRSREKADVKSMYQRVFRGVPDTFSAFQNVKPIRQPACNHLEECYRSLDKAGENIEGLVASFRTIEPYLNWYTHFVHSDLPTPTDEYAEAIILGPTGLVWSDKVEVGISVMAPRARYPDHRHPPEELYIALSKGDWRQEDMPWFEPGVGGLVYNTGNMRHSMRSGPVPLFSVWCMTLSAEL